MSACTRILGLEGTPEGVEDQGRLTRVAAVYSNVLSRRLYMFLIFNSISSFLAACCKSTSWPCKQPTNHDDLIFFFFICGRQFPIGIDSERFMRALELPKVKEHIRELKERFSGRKVRSPPLVLHTGVQNDHLLTSSLA